MLLCLAVTPHPLAQPVPPHPFLELSAADVRDKIRGGLLGQIFGNLNGLPHELKYIDRPGDVRQYTPGLPKGGWTDDDTDIEWVYLVEMQRRGVTMIPPQDIPALWRTHINRSIWCANQYARQLMDLGMAPPLTGMIQFNPWSDFNIAGQFVGEVWGLIAPGMPRTAATIGLNYTRVSISGEPAQATQLFDTMIATAFLTADLDKIIDAGQVAVDPQSVIHRVVSDVRAWHRRHPGDWRAARRLIQEKYTRHGGRMRDKNGFELNTAAVIGALLYGQGDTVKTSLVAFNFGWDADCNAATAGTIVGVIKGARWMMAQGWPVKDLYRNSTRDRMPTDETITRFGDRLIELAGRVIAGQGGEIVTRDGKEVYRIRLQAPHNVEPLHDPAARTRHLRAAKSPGIEAAIVRGEDRQAVARAAYEAICLDLAGPLRRRHPEAWARALEALNGYPKVVDVLFFEAGTPAGDRLRERALAAGLKKPAKRVKIW